MITSKEYIIFKVNKQEYLFTSKGFKNTEFKNMILLEFSNEDMQFFICKLNSQNILIFSQGIRMVEFLQSMGVTKVSYTIAAFNYYEKPRNYDNLECHLNNESELHLSVSHLDGYHNGFLTGPNGMIWLNYENDVFDTHFPRLDKLSETYAEIKTKGSIGDAVYEQNLEIEKSSGCLASMALIITSSLLILLFI